MTAELVDHLRRALALPRSGAEPPPAGRREAAVLLLADPAREGAPVLFVRRAAHLRQHAGQIGLPGGSREPADRDVVATALREAGEEVGVEPGNVEVLGSLAPRLTHRSQLWLTPVIGVQLHPFAVRGDGYEVAEWFWVPLAELRRAPHRVERWERYGEPPRDVHHYQAAGRIIWGVTGQILHDLFELLAAAG